MEIFVVDGNQKTSDECIAYAGDVLVKNHCAKESFPEACLKREESFPTGLPCENPIAIPHASRQHVEKSAICVLRLEEPVMFRRMDDPNQEVPVHLVLNLALEKADEHLVFLSKLMELVGTDEFYDRCLQDDADQVKSYILSVIPA